MDEPKPNAVALTLLIDDRPVRELVVDAGAVQGLPVEVAVERGPGGELLLRAGTDRRVVGGPVDVDLGPGLGAGRVHLSATPVHRRWFQRFSFTQASLLFPLLVVSVSLGAAQISAIAKLIQEAMAEEGGTGGFEPSPELIARLLNGEYDGADRGAPSLEAPRPAEGAPIESYYLQPGHGGPTSKIGGGANIGKKVLDGANKKAPEVEVEVALEPGAAEVSSPGHTDPPQEDAEAKDPEKVPSAEQIAQHMTEGFGFTDWYDTEDARAEAKQIKRALEAARRVLAIDPDDPGAISVLAYYQYLAMDYNGARASYQRFTALYPEEAAGWNNLALTYKREGDYVTEEALYRRALALDPADDHALNNLAVCLAHQGRYDEAHSIMRELDKLIPDDAYADLHRAKIYAAEGKEERAYHFLQRALSAMRRLDTLHNIEFRQDIRVDPAFQTLRGQERFRRLLTRYYGDDPRGWWQKLVR